MYTSVAITTHQSSPYFHALLPRYTGFYFAVQSGGNFEIDYVVLDPDDRVILEGQGEKQGDYIFTANKVSCHDVFTKLLLMAILCSLENTRFALKMKRTLKTSFSTLSMC